MLCVNIIIVMDENFDMFLIDFLCGEVCSFCVYGIVICLIVEVGFYRNGLCIFLFVVLISKCLNNFYDIFYECEWVIVDSFILKVKVRVIKFDWNMGELYGIMVIVCIFLKDVGIKFEGGCLILIVYYLGVFWIFERFIVLIEM